MPVKDKTPSDDAAAAVDYSEVPGYHVLLNGSLLGSYQTREDAQAYIDGHVSDAEIVEGAN